jgi:predicted RNase H-like HicB family nuclease
VKQIRHVIIKYRLAGEIAAIYCGAEDQAFVAEVPELPGCAADGKTYQEAVGNVVIVIQEWIDTAKKLGRSIPISQGRLVFA